MLEIPGLELNISTQDLLLKCYWKIGCSSLLNVKYNLKVYMLNIQKLRIPLSYIFIHLWWHPISYKTNFIVIIVLHVESIIKIFIFTHKKNIKNVRYRLNNIKKHWIRSMEWIVLNCPIKSLVKIKSIRKSNKFFYLFQ